jgi:hypothetical protein
MIGCINLTGNDIGEACLVPALFWFIEVTGRTTQEKSYPWGHIPLK